MKKLFITVIVLSFLMSASASSAGLAAATHLSHVELHSLNSDSARGVIHTVHCIFDKLDQEISVGHYPQKRAKRELEHNRVDMLFPIGAEQIVDGKLSAPITIEKWYWFTNFEPSDFSTKIASKRIGVVAGSTAHYWTVEQHYRVASRVKTTKQLLNMFIAGRVDAIVVDRDHLLKNSALYGSITSTTHFWKFIKFDPRLLVFSNQTLQRQPELIENFNRHIEQCDPASITLLRHEKEQLAQYLRAMLNKLITYFDGEKDLPNLAKLFDLTMVESQWQQQLTTRSGTLYDYLYQSDLSQLLKDIQRDASGRITEIMLMDTNGYNIAVSRPTSDVYQGDEAKFFNTFPVGTKAVHVSKLQFDQSTQTYQSQVSFVISNAEKPIGVVTFGVDVEKVLKDY